MIADNYDPPFSKTLNYSTFAVRINESALVFPRQLRKILCGTPPQRVEELLEGVRRVRPAFQYSRRHAAGEPPGGVAAELVAYQLWRRIRHRPEDFAGDNPEMAPPPRLGQSH